MSASSASSRQLILSYIGLDGLALCYAYGFPTFDAVRYLFLKLLQADHANYAPVLEAASHSPLIGDRRLADFDVDTSKTRRRAVVT